MSSQGLVLSKKQRALTEVYRHPRHVWILLLALLPSSESSSPRPLCVCTGRNSVSAVTRVPYGLETYSRAEDRLSCAGEDKVSPVWVCN